MTRDHLLTRYAWNFAKTTRALSSTGNTPTEWAYEFDYPNDCLRVLYIVPPHLSNNTGTGAEVYLPRMDFEPVPYEVSTGSNGSRTILTDYEDAHIAYTKAVTDERLFDPLFVQAFAWLLAVDLAIPLGGDSAQRYMDRAMKAFDMTIDQAMAHAINENEPGRERLPRSIRARYSTGVPDNYGGYIYRRY